MRQKKRKRWESVYVSFQKAGGEGQPRIEDLLSGRWSCWQVAVSRAALQPVLTHPTANTSFPDFQNWSPTIGTEYTRIRHAGDAIFGLTRII